METITLLRAYGLATSIGGYKAPDSGYLGSDKKEVGGSREIVCLVCPYQP